jgi:hypothetical protein
MSRTHAPNVAKINIPLRDAMKVLVFDAYGTLFDVFSVGER